MGEAAFWGFVSGSALLIGAVVAMILPPSQRAIGLIMGFASGVLISAVAFELTDEAYSIGGRDAVALGLASGALVFFTADWFIDKRGGKHRKRSGGQQAEGAPYAIVLGAILDGIPESLAIGVSLLVGGEVGLAFIAAVFLSNVPEAMSAGVGLEKAGHSRRYILLLWSGVVLLSTAAAVAGYALLGDASENMLGGIQAFAAGAILTMLADTMMPEAFESGGSVVGLLTVLGFSLSFFLSTL